MLLISCLYYYVTIYMLILVCYYYHDTNIMLLFLGFYYYVTNRGSISQEIRSKMTAKYPTGKPKRRSPEPSQEYPLKLIVLISYRCAFLVMFAVIICRLYKTVA